MKSDRLLSTLLLLQAHGRMTGRALAKRLEVSMRTVHRDMEALSAAGVPVYALRGARGGWQLDEDWRTQVPGLDEAELRALLMAQPRVLGDPRLVATAERAFGKLMAALPVSLRDRATSIRQRLFVDTTGWRGTTENLAMLPVVQEAIARDRKLTLQYWRAGRERVERSVDPLGLVAKGSVWYLVAGTSEGFRTYRVSRIEEATMLDAPAARPPDFDLPAYWKASTDRFEEGLPRFDATLRIEPRAAKWLKMWRFSSPIEVVGEPDAEGWITLRIQFDREEEACFVVLGLGPRVDVVAPAALRDRVAAEAAGILSRLPPVAGARRKRRPRS
jgi:predicted DNA-binding transcriptional regulator YafY